MAGKGRSALVVLAEAEPGQCAALGAAAMRGLSKGGWAPSLVDLHGDGFAAVMSRQERLDYETPDPISDPLVRRYAKQVTECGCLVVVYHVPDSAPPAILKGFFERVFVAGVAFTLPSAGQSILGGLNHIDYFIGVCTYDLKRLQVAARGDQGRRLVTRCLRLMSTRVGRRTRWHALHGVHRADAAKAGRFLTQVENSMAKL